MATDNEHPSEEYGEERSPWSKPSVMLSGMFVLALLLAGIAFVIFNGGNSTHHSHTATPATSSPTASATTSVTTTAAIGGCSLPAGNQTVPSLSPPPGTMWHQVGSMQAPQAPSALGPERTNGVWNTCFAHNPSGALLAAFNLWAETTAASPTDVFHRLGIGAPSNLGNNDRLDAGGPVQFAGYKYQSYTPSTAEVFVVIHGPQGKLAAAETTMRWTGQDWRYVFPPGGQLSLQVIPDLTGYVSWSAF